MNRSFTNAKILHSDGVFEHDWQASGDCSDQTDEKGTVPFTRLSRKLHVTFTLRAENTKIRVISVRDMHSKERARYEKET